MPDKNNIVNLSEYRSRLQTSKPAPVNDQELGIIIYVDFAPTTSLENYLSYLRINGIEEDDILEIEEAINDVAVFEDADEDIQALVMKWFG